MGSTTPSSSLSAQVDLKGTATRSNISLVVTLICWGMVVLEGYDLISFGSVLPVLVSTKGSGFNPANAGVVGSMAFLGATVGALSSGWLSDRYGRRAVAISCVMWFSVFTMLCGFADGPGWLGTLRFLAGIGMGGIVPATSALTLEYASARRRTLLYTLMLSGVPIGGVLAAIAALAIIPHFGWRWVFFIALVPALIALPFVIAKLPESITYLEQSGRSEQAARLRERFGLPTPAPYVAPDQSQVGKDAALAKSAVLAKSGIFSTGYRTASILFAVGSFFGLLVWFGLGTWIPGIMRATGYDLGDALVFLLILNFGAILGSLVIAVATDHFGSKQIIVPTYLVLAVVLLILMIKMPQPPLLIAMALAGIGGHGGQVLMNRFVGRSYVSTIRASALGWTLGAGRLGTVVGPIVIGYIVAGGHALLGFAFFAACAVVAAVLLWLIPRTHAARVEER